MQQSQQKISSYCVLSWKVSENICAVTAGTDKN